MGPQANFKLISHRCSPFSQRVNIALLEKGVKFETIPVDFTNKPQLLLETNPIWEKVPVLIQDDKKVVAESPIILEYLEDLFPEKAPLMPKDPHAKAQVRFWADYIHKELAAFIEYSKLPTYTPAKLAGREASVNFIRTLDSTMTTYSKNGPFFTGDKFGFLDVALAPFAGVLPLVQAGDGLVIPGPEETPRFFHWLKAVRSHPSVKASLPSIQEYVSFLIELGAVPSSQLES